MLIRAFQIGLTEAQFWKTTPKAFSLMVEAYERRQDEESARFRSLFTLFCNIHRKEKARPVTGAEVWPLFMDQFAPKEQITRKAKKIQSDKFQALTKRFNL